MAPLKTGRPYELVFGPGVNLGPGAESDAIDLVYAETSGVDPQAIVLSVASEGLKVIGSEDMSAIDAGRAACSIRCRVFDRRLDTELSTEVELARSGPAPKLWHSPKPSSFDGRNRGASRYKPFAKRPVAPARNGGKA
jgi:hypothetical protein